MGEIKRFRGDTIRMGAVVKQNKKVMNVDGCTFKLTVDERENPTDSTTRKFQSIASIVDAAAGKISFSFVPSDVDFVGEFFYDFEMTNIDGEIKTLDKGTFIFEQDITKA
jgi:hypothetical protein